MTEELDAGCQGGERHALRWVPFHWAAPFTDYVNGNAHGGMNRGPSKDNTGLTRILSGGSA